MKMNPQLQIAYGDAKARRARQLSEYGRNSRAEIWMLAAQCHWAVASGKFYGYAAMVGETWRGEFRREDREGWKEL